MSFRGGNRGGGGGRGGRGGFYGRGGGGRGRSFNRPFEQGPPEKIIPLGYFDYTCEDDLICKVEITDVPFFNAPIYLENKQQIGKIDEIFGHIRNYFVSIRVSENMKSFSLQRNQKLFIDPTKLLPIDRFLPKAPGLIQKKKGAGGGGRGGGRGGRGGSGGFSRGGPGGFSRGGQGGFSRGGRGGFSRDGRCGFSWGGRGGGGGRGSFGGWGGRPSGFGAEAPHNFGSTQRNMMFYYK